MKTLPSDILEKPASIPSDNEPEEPEEESKDDEFTVKEEDEADNEDTIAEQEKHDKKIDYSKELKDLEDESDLPMEELYKKYAAAYDSDFEFDEPSDGDEEDDDDESEEETAEEEDGVLLFHFSDDVVSRHDNANVILFSCMFSFLLM